MTLPIIPGPFSFLTEAGKALGSVGSALTERDRYKQALAAQNSEFLTRLIAAGVVTPETLGMPDTQDLFTRAGGVPIQPSQVEVPSATVLGRRRKEELAKIPAGTPQSQIATGLPTEAQASVDTAKGAEAEVAIRGLAEIISPEQLRQYLHLLSPDAAKIAEKVYLEKAQTELQQQDPQRLEAQMQSEIRKDVLRRLPRDPTFAKVADYAAVGGLGYLLQDLDNYGRIAAGGRALNTEKIRLVTAVTSQAGSAYRQALKQWQDGLNLARNQALGFEASELDPQERAKKLNEVDKDYTTRNPMPLYSDFLDAGLQEGGLTKGDFQEAFRSLVHVPSATNPGANSLQTVIQMYQNRELTDADIDASTRLTPAQKAQIKALPKKRP